MAAKTIRKRARRSKRVTPETANNIQIADYLRAHRIRFRRNQVGVAKYGGGARCRYVPYGEKGEADWTAYVPVPGIKRAFYILHIETKAEKGTQEFEQKIWQQCAEANGEFYLLAKSYEPIEAFLKSKGVIR